MSQTSANTIIEKIEAFLNTWMVFTQPEQATLCALWVLHTWTFGEGFAERPYTTPYLYINSAGPQSGKTTLLELLETIALNPEKGADMTSVAMFQLIESAHPTLLIDEVDTVFAGSKQLDLQRTMNSGYTRSGYAWRAGRDGEPVKFATFCAKLLSGIDNGYLPETVSTRSIEIFLRPCAEVNEEGEIVAPDGTTRPIKYAFEVEPVAEALTAEIAAFMAEWTANYQRYIPKPIKGMKPRVWEIAMPLVQVARAAGGEQGENTAREVLAKLTAPKPKADSPETAMLRKIRDHFETTGADRAFSDALAGLMTDESQAEWSQKLFSSRLQAVMPDQRSKVIVIGNEKRRGYLRSQFNDAFAAHNL